MATNAPLDGFDYDWLVIGSGFGGSVSALRLSEKGYRVGVLEMGRRFRDEDFSRTTWDLRNFNWVPGNLCSTTFLKASMSWKRLTLRRGPSPCS